MSDYKDQRASERLSVNATSTCDFVSPVLEDCGPVRVKNVSKEGIGLVSSQRLDADLLIVVKLTNPAKKFSKTMLARVVHCTPQPGGGYLVGAILESPLTYEELCIFVM